jgi:succinate-acetate transporter protein
LILLGIFLISSFGVHARGVQTPNVMISVLIFFGGICQYLVGIMEFVTGNTFGTAVFMSYGAFNISYSMIYLPGSGIIAAYTDSSGNLTPDFQQSIALYLWAWFILTAIYTFAAVRSSWVLFLDFVALDVCLILLATGNMVQSNAVLDAGYAFGYLVAIFSCELSSSSSLGYFADGLSQTGLVARAFLLEVRHLSKSRLFRFTRRLEHTVWCGLSSVSMPVVFSYCRRLNRAVMSISLGS